MIDLNLAPGVIAWASLEPVRGREQDGHRPVLVIASAGYLQAVTTREQTWLERSSEEESPAQAAADTLVQVVTLFVVQSPAPASVKTLVVSKVDELRQARTERISLSRRASRSPAR